MSSYDDPYMSNYKKINSIVITHKGRYSAEVIAKYTARKANLDIISYNLLVPVRKNVFMLFYATPYSKSDNKSSDAFFKELIRAFKIK